MPESTKTHETIGNSAMTKLFAEVEMPEFTRARLAQVGTRIRTQYGVTQDSDVLLIDAAEMELAKCEGCAGYPCHKSTNAGFIPVLSVNGEVFVSMKICKEYVKHNAQVELSRKLKAAKIPPRYRGKTFANYKTDKNNQVAVTFAKSVLLKGYSGAFFYGKAGTGKTFLAALIAQEFVKAGKTALFEKVADLLTEFHEIYRGKSQESEKELLSKLYNVDLLVLDDFGMEKTTKFVGTTLCKILDARYDREGITTIITSNLKMAQVADSLNKPADAEKSDICLNGTRIQDRCIEICKTIEFQGDSRRE